MRVGPLILLDMAVALACILAAYMYRIGTPTGSLEEIVQALRADRWFQPYISVIVAAPFLRAFTYNLFGVYDESMGLALRGTFIINPDGKLVASEVNFYNVGRYADELARKMAANSYLSTHPDEVCPSNWTPGEKTLKPGAQMVGKVYEALKETAKK